MNIEEHRTTKTCPSCLSLFEAVRQTLDGRPLFEQTRCIPCAARERAATAFAPPVKADPNSKWFAICPPLYRDTDLNRLPCPKATQDRVLGWKPGPTGLVLRGPSRSGKTRLAFALLRKLHDGGSAVQALTSTAFAHTVGRLFAAGMDEAVRFIEGLCAVDVLFLDDLGKGRMTDRVECELFHVLETRSANKLPVLVTLNADGSGLQSMMSDDRGEPILQRLREFNEIVSVLPLDSKA